MNRNIYIGLGLVVLVVVVFVLVKKYDTSQNTNVVENSGIVENQSKSKLITGTDAETFSGTITAVDTGCFSDRICSVTVDNKKIILMEGGRGQSPDIQVGKLLGVNSIDELQQRIGQHANVYATTTSAGEYTLYGNSKYYVEVVVVNK